MACAGMANKNDKVNASHLLVVPADVILLMTIGSSAMYLSTLGDNPPWHNCYPSRQLAYGAKRDVRVCCKES